MTQTPETEPAAGGGWGEDLARFAAAFNGIRTRQQEVEELSKERMRLVLRLRRNDPPVLFSALAEAAGTTEQTIYKVHREARRAEEAGEL